MDPQCGDTPGDVVPRNAEELAKLFTRHRDHLWRMVRFRLDPRLAQRVDASDILQEAYLNAQQRLVHAEKMEATPLVWLRQVTEQTLIDLHRRHLGAERRDAGREVSLNHAAVGMTTSISMAAVLASDQTTPSQEALRVERRHWLEQALEQMDPIDREVLALRHFEEMSNNEVAEVLGLQATAASNRYVRALQRFKQIVESLSVFNSK